MSGLADDIAEARGNGMSDQAIADAIIKSSRGREGLANGMKPQAIYELLNKKFGLTNFNQPTGEVASAGAPEASGLARADKLVAGGISKGMLTAAGLPGDLEYGVRRLLGANPNTIAPTSQEAVNWGGKMGLINQAGLDPTQMSPNEKMAGNMISGATTGVLGSLLPEVKGLSLALPAGRKFVGDLAGNTALGAASGAASTEAQQHFPGSGDLGPLFAGAGLGLLRGGGLGAVKALAGSPVEQSILTGLGGEAVAHSLAGDSSLGWLGFLAPIAIHAAKPVLRNPLPVAIGAASALPSTLQPQQFVPLSQSQPIQETPSP